MKNLKFIYILSLALLISTSCEQELIELTPPVVVPPVDNGTPGTANFTKFIAIGNSFVAGVQGGALFTTQVYRVVLSLQPDKTIRYPPLWQRSLLNPVLGAVRLYNPALMLHLGGTCL